MRPEWSPKLRRSRLPGRAPLLRQFQLDLIRTFHLSGDVRSPLVQHVPNLVALAGRLLDLRFLLTADLLEVVIGAHPSGDIDGPRDGRVREHSIVDSLIAANRAFQIVEAHQLAAQ